EPVRAVHRGDRSGPLAIGDRGDRLEVRGQRVDVDVGVEDRQPSRVDAVADGQEAVAARVHDDTDVERLAPLLRGHDLQPGVLEDLAPVRLARGGGATVGGRTGRA